MLILICCHYDSRHTEYHSTEAPCTVVRNTAQTIDAGDVSVVLLDLSAAFDTVEGADRDVLLEVLNFPFVVDAWRAILIQVAPIQLYEIVS